MKKVQFSIEIKAPKEKVWNTLWDDKTFRDWSGIIDEGTHIVGELKAGNEVQFISSAGYGVTSLVDKLEPNKFLLLRHKSDTMENGEQEREKEWTGGTESYSLAEKAGITILTAEMDMPPEQEELFKDIFPKALQRVKVLAENKE